MARTTLSYLITHVRELINDPAGTAQVFSDDAIQRHLDAHRVDLYTEPLAAIPTWTGGGSTAYYEYRAGWPWLEATSGGVLCATGRADLLAPATPPDVNALPCATPPAAAM